MCPRCRICCLLSDVEPGSVCMGTGEQKCDRERRGCDNEMPTHTHTQAAKRVVRYVRYGTTARNRRTRTNIQLHTRIHTHFINKPERRGQSSASSACIRTAVLVASCLLAAALAAQSSCSNLPSERAVGVFLCARARAHNECHPQRQQRATFHFAAAA